MSYIAEQNVIGSILLDPNCISEIYSLLEPEMFTSSFLGRVYHEFQKGYDNRYDVSLVVLEQKMRSDEYPSSVIVSEIQEIMSQTLTSATVKYEANVIVKDYKARKFNEFLNTIKITPNNIEEQLRAISEEIDVVQGTKQSKSQTLAEITKESKDKYFCESVIPKTYIGFPKLDDILGGLESGDMIVIGARPGVGKSALVTQITSNLAKQGKRVGFYNLEMQSKQVYERFVVSESGIGLTRLRRAKRFLGDEKERFDRANEVLEKADNIIISTGSKKISEIRNESRHMDYDIMIIDYLQLVKSDVSYRGNRYAEVGSISKAIKALAMELNIPIIALSQINRVSEMRDTKEPTMSELREAGDIEQDASIIILLWNVDSEDISKKGCKVEKNRQGTSGKVAMNFNGDLMRFEETDRDLKSNSNSGWKESSECPFS